MNEGSVRLQSKGPVAYAWRVSTPTVEMEELWRGLENSGKNVAPVSSKKEMGLSDTDSITLSSETVMVVGSTDPGPCRSLVARPIRFPRPRFGLGDWFELEVVGRETVSQSTVQLPVPFLPQIGQGFGGGLGLRQAVAQWPC